MKNENLKSTLKNGSVVQTRDGDVGFVMDNTVWFIVGLAAGGKDFLDNYNDDLIHLDDTGFEGEWDIVKIWHNCNGFTPNAINNMVQNRKPSWERKDENEDTDCDTPQPLISKGKFAYYIKELRTFDKNLNSVIDTIYPTNYKDGYINIFADFVESNYVSMLAMLLRLSNEERNELVSWCFADNFGTSEKLVSFGGEQLTAEQVYEKLTSK